MCNENVVKMLDMYFLLKYNVILYLEIKLFFIEFSVFYLNFEIIIKSCEDFLYTLVIA